MNSYSLTRRELLSVLFREKRPMLIAFFTIAILVTVVSYIIPPSYEADAKLLIRSGREFETRADPGEGQITTPYVTKQEVINSELEILSSNDLIASVIDRVGLAKIYPDIAASPPSDMRPIDLATKQFVKDFKAEAAAMSEVITLTYYNQNRDVAIQVLSTLIQVYQEKHATVFGEERAGFFDQQIKTYDSRLADLTRKITDLREHESLFDVTAQRAQLIQDRSSVADELRSVRSRSVDAHGRINYYRGRLKAMTPLVVEGDAPGDAVEAAKSKLLDLQTQLLTLQQRFSADVKPIRDLKSQIDEVQDFIDGKGVSNHKVWLQRDTNYDDAIKNLQTAEADAASTDAQVALQQKNLDEMDQRLRSLEEGSRTLEALERDHTMLDDLAKTTRARYSEAQSNAEMDKSDVVSISILEKPDASTKAAKPKHSVFALIGVALGLAGASSILFYSLLFHETLITAESAERLLRVKVLTVVPLYNSGS